MRTLIPVDEKLFSEAEFGATNIYYIITLKKAEELRKDGFVVTDSKEQKGSPRVHKIDWTNAGEKFKDVEDIFALNEKDSQYTLPERLWIIAAKVKKDSVRYYKTH